MPESSRKRKYTSLENALRALKSFSEDNPELGISELSDKLGIGKSTTHRILSTLAEEDFVVKNPLTNKYTLGLSVLQLTNTVTEQLKIIKESAPVLRKLTEETGESSHVGIIDGEHVIYLQKVDGIHPVKLDSHLGKRNPVHCTSSGLVILAFQPAEFIDEVLSHPLKAYTDHTITEPSKLKDKLAVIREKGYVLSDREFRPDVYAIGAPLYKDQKVIASINIAGPAKRVKPQHKYFAEKVVEASRKLSRIITARSERRTFL